MATDLLSLRLAFRALSDQPDGDDDTDPLADDDTEINDDMDDLDDEGDFDGTAPGGDEDDNEETE